MKTSCEVIKDLLPLYHDGVCSDESKALVEEHLTECDNCKAELLSMVEIIPIRNEVQNMNEAKALKGLSKKWKRGKLYSFLRGAVIAIIVIVVLALIFSIFGTIRIDF
jgi:predicted anti-sigma-YlaC factor YlaD